MSNKSKKRIIDRKHEIAKRIIVCMVILLVGAVGFRILASLKKPPAEIEFGERPIKVNVIKAAAKSVAVSITGYGQVQSLDSVKISAEVSGQVDQVHPRLEVGEVIAKGELLFQIDNRNYSAALAQSEAEVGRWASVLDRLNKQFVIDRSRLKTLERSRDLSKNEFNRMRDLLSKHSVGTRSGVERAEQSYNAALDQSDQMAQAVALYPSRINEAKSSLASAQARLNKSKADLERCQVKAPFTGRLTQVTVEAGQYVAPGRELITLADDTVLEIQVPLDSRDVRRWLRFDTTRSASTAGWFGLPKAVACQIRWTEDKQGHVWSGALQRVVTFDQKTRTVTVAIRIDSAKMLSQNRGLPLVEGMFCEVKIPGRQLSDAYQIPRVAVSFQNTVYVARDKRLKTIPVEVAKVDNDYAYITGGLSNGDQVITTRLVDPLENALLEIMADDPNITAQSATDAK